MPRLPRTSFAIPRLTVLAAMGMSCFTFVEPVHAAEGTTNVVITENAKQHFRAGVALLQDPDGARYGEAYHEFKTAYAESPSWKILGNLGISAMKLERDGEAIEAFQIYLRDGDLDDSERAQVQRDLDLLKAQVTWVTLSSEPGGGAVLDTRTPVAGRPIENRYDALNQPLRLGLHAGRHTIRVELEGREPAVWTFDAKGGELTHVFELKEQAKAPEPIAGGSPSTTTKTYERPVPVGAFIGIGATVLLAGGATVTGLMALDKKSAFSSANGVDENAAALRSDGQTLNLVTDILIGSSVVAAAVTTYLYVTRPSVEVSAQASNLQLVPVASPSGGGLSVSGRF